MRKSNNNKTGNFWILGKTVILFAAIFMLCIHAPANSLAQDELDSLPKDTLILKNEHNNIALTPYTYAIPDTARSHMPETLMALYQANKRPPQLNGNVLYLGKIADPVWLVFSVYNNTDNENWVIDLGSISDGKSGLIDKFYLLNYTTEERYPKENTELSMIGSGLPIKIASGKRQVFIAYLEPAQGLPLILAPQLKTQNLHLQILLNGKLQDILIAVFFISALSFLTAFFFFRRYLPALPLIGYFSLLYISLYLMDGFIMAKMPFQNSILIMLLGASFILSLLVTKLFVRIPFDRYPIENIALGILATLMLAASVVFAFILPTDVYGYLAFTGSTLLVMIANILICIFTKHNNQMAMSTYCGGWLVAIFAMTIGTSAGINIIPANPFTIHAFLFSLVPQSLLFALAFVQGYQDILIEKNRLRSRKKQEEKNLARLQKSKESADQARLLRVIERERELMKELREREIKRTEEMRIAKNAADKANQAKSAFLAVVSHEIRTPMTSVLGMLRLIRDTNLDKKQKEYVETIRKSGETMMALLNDILDFEKIEHGSMDLEIVPFEVEQLAKDIVTLTSGHAAQKNMYIRQEITPDIPDYIMGDPTRLRQILLNLITNGLKFTEKGGVTLYIDRDDQKDHGNDILYVRFRVVDTGIGISEEGQRKLFTPFTQAESSTSREYGGTGLGLAISNKLVEAMKGKIRVESREGQGSTFYFTIPMQLAKTAQVSSRTQTQAQDTASPKYETPPMRILITEDNEMNRQVLQGLLEKDGHTIYLAANGPQALEICAKEKPDLILMDIEMDGMNGEETTRKIRNTTDQKIARIPIIALTGNIRLEDIERYFSIQMNGFIAKPIDPDKLYGTIHDAHLGKFENPMPPLATSVEIQSSTLKEKPAFSDINKPLNPLAHIPQNFELDEREHFLSDADLDLKSSKAAITPASSTPVGPDFSKKDKTSKSPESEKKEKSAGFNGKDKDKELTEIQKYLIGMNTPDAPAEMQSPEILPQKIQEQYEDIVENEPEKTEAIASKSLHFAQVEHMPPREKIDHSGKTQIDDYLNLILLDNLSTTLGKDPIKGLLDGFVKKSDEIIEQLNNHIKAKDIKNIGIRSHELKGMAGNFGMTMLSDIAGLAEKSAKTNTGKEALEHASRLDQVNSETKEYLSEWLEKL